LPVGFEIAQSNYLHSRSIVPKWYLCKFRVSCILT
jgi:hypothetical protein